MVSHTPFHSSKPVSSHTHPFRSRLAPHQYLRYEDTRPGENSSPLFPSLCVHRPFVLAHFDSLALAVALLTYVTLAK